MGPNDMSVQEIVMSVIFGVFWVGVILMIVWAAVDPCKFKGHEKPKIRMLHPTCWRCGKELKESGEWQ